MKKQALLSLLAFAVIAVGGITLAASAPYGVVAQEDDPLRPNASPTLETRRALARPVVQMKTPATPIYRTSAKRSSARITRPARYVHSHPS